MAARKHVCVTSLVRSPNLRVFVKRATFTFIIETIEGSRELLERWCHRQVVLPECNRNDLLNNRERFYCLGALLNGNSAHRLHRVVVQTVKECSAPAGEQSFIDDRKVSPNVFAHLKRR